MPNPTFIIGGPGSGKTEEVITRLAASYEADPFFEALALAPTVRHCDQLRSRLVRRCGVALGLRVETLGQLSRGLASGRQVPSYALAEELLARTVLRQVGSGPAAHFGPIADTAGFRRLANTAIGDLLSEAVDPRALSSAADSSGSASLKALGAIFSAYSLELKKRGWTHPAQIGSAAAAAVRAGAKLPRVVMVDGFQLFSGTEIELLESLVERSDVLITLDPEAGARSRHDHKRLVELFPNADVVELTGAAEPPMVIAGDSADREGQVRAIARQIKQRLTDEPTLRPSDFAVVFRQASPHLSLARQVFSEYDLPLDPAAGERLSNRPLGVWLRRLLHLARDGWRLRDLVTVLSSGFVDTERWRLSRTDIARFARRARESHLWAGQDALGRAVGALRTDADSATASDERRQGLRHLADGMAKALEELRALLEGPEASAAEHARRMEEALFGKEALIDPDSRAIPGVETELDAVQEHLRDLAATHEALGGQPEPLDAFLARVEGKLDSSAVVLREAGGVLLAPMHTLHGLRFRHVAVGGLIEGEFPAPRRSSSLLGGSAIDELNQAGLGLPPEARLSEDELWESVSSRADGTLSLWKTRLDERGRPASASYYYDASTPSERVDARSPTPELTASPRELAIACSKLWPTHGRLRPRGADTWPVVRSAVEVEQLRRSFNDADEYEGRLASGLVPRLTDANAVWSATRLESYRTCAFQFFGQYALQLRELDQEMESADALTRGIVVHEILQDAMQPLVEEGLPLSSDTLASALARLYANGAEMWDSAPERMGFGRAALWRLDGETTLEQIGSLLEREVEHSARAGVKRVAGVERQIEASLPLEPPLRVIATVDRLDDGDDLVVIVDYKTGRAIPQSQVLSGQRVQLQLYGYLVRQEATAARVIARYAWLDPTARVWELDSTVEEDAEVLEGVVGVAEDVRSAVEAGDFRVNPKVPTCPSYCSLRHVCRVNQFSRWKHWD